MLDEEFQGDRNDAIQPSINDKRQITVKMSSPIPLANSSQSVGSSLPIASNNITVSINAYSAVNSNTKGTAAPDPSPVSFKSSKDLGHELELFFYSFDGKETEQNWALRDQALHRLRAVLRGLVINPAENGIFILIKEI